MSEIIQKISAYDLMNTLIPGGVLLYVLQLFGYIDLQTVNAFVELTLAYFLGLIGSRVGSLLLEPIAIKCGLVQRDYPAFIRAQKVDDKITALSAVANMYRTLASSALMVAVLVLFELFPAECRIVAGGLCCLVLFLCAWIKQEHYVNKRIELNLEDGKNVDY
ncbi:hypothetical protein [Enorma massiliensis]|uniref:hypothetical protein n=1 Tax=Enorma massiliensis TaxID=1472761 RepID=UPI0023F41E2A|nr:hypothetical protein [Enorma massiliensis]